MKKTLVILAVLAGLIVSGCVKENDKMKLLYVTDKANNRVVVLDHDLNFQDSFNGFGVYTVWKITVDSDYIYTSSYVGNLIRKYERAAPYNLVASVEYLYGNRDLDQDENYIYMASTTTDYDKYVIIVNKSNLSQHAKFEVFPDTGYTYISGIAVDDDYIYVSAYQLHKLNKYKKSTHTLVKSVDIAGESYPCGLGIDGPYVYVTTRDAISIFNKSDLSLLKNISKSGIFEGAVDVAVCDGYAFFGDLYDVLTIKKLNIATETIEATYNGGIEGRGLAIYTSAGADAEGEAPWKEDILDPTGEVKVEIPRRSGQWTTLEDVMRIHTSNGKNPFTAVEIGQAEAICCNISKNFNSFEEASDWYKNLEGYAAQIKLGCDIGGSPISVKLFTGIISAVDPVDRATLTAHIKVIDFLDYFGRVTIEETPIWENISLTQLFKNLVELVFSEWTHGVDYFVEDLGGSTIPAIGYTDLNLLSELKMIAESRGKRIYTDTSGRLHCASRSPERDPLTVKYDYNLEDVKEKRDINSILNWIIVHATPYEIKPDLEAPGKITGFTATPGDQKIDLTWHNPTDDDFVKVMIRYSTTAYPLNTEDGTKVYEGTGESKEHTGLTNGQKYYYSAWTVDDKGNWSDAAHASATAGVGGDTWGDETGPSRVSQFTATPEHSKIILTWYNPSIADFDKVVIRRSTTSYPSTPTSGSAEYDGTAETHEDTGLTNGIRYYYSAFAKNTSGDYSGAAFASAIPAGLRKVISTKIISGGKYAGPGGVGTYFSDYSKKVRLSFAVGGRTEGWLRFRSRWDVQTTAGPRHPSGQRHTVGLADDLSLTFGKSLGNASISVRKVSCSAKMLVVDYTLTLTARVLKISFRNELSLMG